MKYMHFKASCSYPALAAMMEYYGTDTEDYRIALEMKLPWLFAGADGAFISGTMLQGAKWFDLWLAPRGYRMEEERVSRDKLCVFLRGHIPAMVGIRTDSGKHAVVFTGYDGAYHFINPVREGSAEPDRLSLKEEELLCRTEEEATVGMVAAAEPEEREILPLLQTSVRVIRENRPDAELASFCEWGNVNFGIIENHLGVYKVNAMGDELTRKSFTFDEWAKGSRVIVDTKCINHVDIFNVADKVDKLISSGVFSIDAVLSALGYQPLNTEFSQAHYITKNYELAEDAMARLTEGGEQ